MEFIKSYLSNYLIYCNVYIDKKKSPNWDFFLKIDKTMHPKSA